MTPPALRDDANVIQRLYDSDPQREWQRLERHRTEYAVTLRALTEHLPPPPARILDCGGGPGRYAIELARVAQILPYCKAVHLLALLADAQSKGLF
jgi:ubiquinone/menaquinone biosynthesis C-methylase UbiE